MLDIKWITENRTKYEQALKNRGATIPLDSIFALNENRKKIQTQFDELKAEQNKQSKQIGLLKKEGKDAAIVMEAMKAVSDQLKDLSARQSQAEDELNKVLLELPNVPHQSVPVGVDENANKEVLKWGEIKKFSFKPKDHSEIGEQLGILDFERGAKIAGARFTLYKKMGAKLERALINFMLDVQSGENNYCEVLPPFLVNADSMTGTGQLPKFEADLFKTTAGYYLIPTAEVPVTNIFRDEILNEKDLPQKFCAYTPCFRSEAGSHGKDVKGLIRQHQFNKVELVQFTHPEKSYEALEELTNSAESILKKLELPYRKVILCTGDMGFGSAKTYDLEVWLPAPQKYREISSCTNFEDFQSRRMKIRFKDAGKNRFVHTLNGSGLAVGRTLLAILENYQNEDGSVTVPEVLKKYLGCDVIG